MRILGWVAISFSCWVLVTTHRLLIAIQGLLSSCDAWASLPQGLWDLSSQICACNGVLCEEALLPPKRASLSPPSGVLASGSEGRSPGFWKRGKPQECPLSPLRIHIMPPGPAAASPHLLRTRLPRLCSQFSAFKKFTLTSPSHQEAYTSLSLLHHRADISPSSDLPQRRFRRRP